MTTKMMVTPALFLLLALIGGSSATVYNHSCGIAYKIGVHQAHRVAIVKTLNELRSAIVAGTGRPTQPPAVSMRKIEWDFELEDSAQRVAGLCRYKRGGYLNVSSKFGDVGQTIYSRRRPRKEGVSTPWSGVMHLWEDEEIKFNPNNIAPFKFSAKAQDYTQLAWADSYAEGCGYAHYLPRNDTLYHSLYVCHFGPKGNVEGAVMYQVKSPPTTTPSDNSVDNSGDNSLE